MPFTAVTIPSSAAFWDDAARRMLDSGHVRDASDLSDLRVLVPTFEHLQLLKQALARRIGRTFVPPTITTLSAALGLLPPAGTSAVASSERLMALYAQLRQHGWLKKLFAARRNTDLLPLAETLLTLSDELTQAMLPSLQAKKGDDAEADRRWQQALEQLSPVARYLLSDETQLVWTIWKSQLDIGDANVVRFAQMMQLAEHARQPLFWISPVEPDAMEQAFLDAYSQRQAVIAMTLDWNMSFVDPVYARAWPEMLAMAEDDAPADVMSGNGIGNEIDDQALSVPPGLALYPAQHLEDEARAGAQTIIDWLSQGKERIAIVAQDRVVARRIRALLERAPIHVADETGWKLSTTRAAAAIAAWLELVASRAETVNLLDFLKSPFVFAGIAEKADLVMVAEIALHRDNVLGGWDAADAALAAVPDAQRMVAMLAQQAAQFVGRKSLCAWLGVTDAALRTLGMRDAMQADAAGAQVMQLLQAIADECENIDHDFSFAEWRAFVDLQLEATAFVQPNRDRRVVMLPLNGARLRRFDAVLLVGADADHLPSRPVETLFFANAVRRELGLATRESRQRQQLRDVTELLMANDCVVMSWQMHRNGEPNPMSPWLERLELTLAQAAAAPLKKHQVTIASRTMTATLPFMPAPRAAALRPSKLSASGYNSLVACPYQFFATRMLGLSGLDELSEMPEKRDYGDWLHRILAQFHQALQQGTIPADERASLLDDISERVFRDELRKSAAALGYYARWKKTMPAYLAWVEERETGGWRFVFGEQRFEKLLQWDDGEILLHGRIDRVDENAGGARGVLDYKSTNRTALSERLKQGEDQQLPFYGLLSDVPLEAAAYVPLEATKERIREADADDYARWQQMLEQRIVDSMRGIDQGAPLPASGPESVCRYCDVRGLCRKGAW
ncbi:MAG TPA: PD-(D/E)XK nuclease family protein [Oxalicibacterium sp.]|nr:PD-(D/E)XK nuclease family protein [Oxalicibacterium sp.]